MPDQSFESQPVVQSVDQLNTRFGQGENLVFDCAPGSGLTRASIVDPNSGHSGEMFLQGAHVTRWRTASGEDLLFVSQLSEFKTGAAIRGGIPVVFPQFGPGKLKSHGFARTAQWSVVQSGITPGGVELILELNDTAETRAVWDNRFNAQLKVVVGPELVTEFVVRNLQNSPFSFTMAFHTYHQISDIQQIKVRGLKGCEYFDRLIPGIGFCEEQALIEIDREVDRDYRAAANTIEILDEGAGRIVQVTKAGMSDAVLWNPWIEKGKMLPLADEEFRKMLCIEPGVVVEPVTLEPEGVWVGRQTLGYRGM